jgi:dihydrofolate reductase
MIKIVAAYCKGNRVIGKDGKLPWPTLEGDLAHFRKITTGGSVIMGSRTFDSLPKILAGRHNIVLTRDKSLLSSYPAYTWLRMGGYCYAADINTALRYCPNQAFVIGGGSVYRQFLDLDLADEVIATEVKQDYEGDTYFPALSREWEGEIMKECGTYDIISYRKKEVSL